MLIRRNQNFNIFISILNCKIKEYDEHISFLLSEDFERYAIEYSSSKVIIHLLKYSEIEIKQRIILKVLQDENLTYNLLFHMKGVEGNTIIIIIIIFT